MITIDLPGTPIPKGRPRFGRGKAKTGRARAYTPARTAAYAKSLAWAAKVAMIGKKPLRGALEVYITATFQGPHFNRHVSAPDLDNVCKALDALNGIVWADDCQLCMIKAYKFYGDTAGLTIQVHEL